MNGLAWDDDDDYIIRLQNQLLQFDVALEVHRDREEFAKRLVSERWDFVVTDLKEKDKFRKNSFKDVGHILAANAARQVPLVFVITSYIDQLMMKEFSLPDNVLFRSKEVEPAFMAQEICENAKTRGIFVNRKKIFILSGHDNNSNQPTKYLLKHLEDLGLSHTLQLTKSDANIDTALIDRIKDCAAFIAVCTPDEKVGTGARKTFYQPPAGVLLGLGMMMGMARGKTRSIILRRWGNEKEEQTHLPLDFDSVLKLDFFGDIRLELPKLVESLRERRVDLSGVSATVPQHGNKELRILFLTSNPSQTVHLDVEEELRSLKKELKGVHFRESIALEVGHAVRPEDIIEYVRSEQPNVIHFSGHGSKDGIVLRNNTGGIQTIDNENLQRILEGRNVALLVLNACYSRSQADAIFRAYKIAVVGTTDAIDDAAARGFTVAFYRALGNGLSVDEAFRDAKDEVSLMGVTGAFQSTGDLNFTLVGKTNRRQA